MAMQISVVAKRQHSTIAELSMIIHILQLIDYAQTTIVYKKTFTKIINHSFYQQQIFVANILYVKKRNISTTWIAAWCTQFIKLAPFRHRFTKNSPCRANAGVRWCRTGESPSQECAPARPQYLSPPARYMHDAALMVSDAPEASANFRSFTSSARRRPLAFLIVLLSVDVRLLRHARTFVVVVRHGGRSSAFSRSGRRFYSESYNLSFVKSELTLFSICE